MLRTDDGVVTITALDKVLAEGDIMKSLKPHPNIVRFVESIDIDAGDDLFYGMCISCSYPRRTRNA
ncbi:MAG: hypothetical protein EOO65_04585 [Methanosarcinales archaeon]|nr:MAG: hypothetical protein EOO65_04585 [Methanosarcinales archaeon]